MKQLLKPWRSKISQLGAWMWPSGSVAEPGNRNVPLGGAISISATARGHLWLLHASVEERFELLRKYISSVEARLNEVAEESQRDVCGERASYS
jgi:hypothetical protein